MTYKLTALLTLMIIVKLSYGQTCSHNDLSTKFDFRTTFRRLKSITTGYDSCIISINIVDKLTKKHTQTITLIPSADGDIFSDGDGCNSVRSYTTGKNVNAQSTDGDYGVFIIADFNFDSKEDIAVKNDVGGNSGPTYTYYIQNKNGQFLIDSYLTDNMEFFPTFFNKKKRTLTTVVFADVAHLGETTFKLNTLNNSCIKTGHRFLEMKDK